MPTPSRRIIYARGFPYGAPKAMIRGGGTKDKAVKEFLYEKGFRWEGRPLFAWVWYADRRELGAILKTLRDEYGCEVSPKTDMDTNYIIDLDSPTFSRP